MNKLIMRAMIVMGSVCSLAGPSYACVYPPYVWISDWEHYIAVNEDVTIVADESSGTYITDWDWSYSSTYGIRVSEQYDGYGYYPYSSRKILFQTTGEWRIDAEATNSDDLTDYDYARVYVIAVDIDGPEYLGVDDVRPVYLAMEPSMTTGILKLSKTVSGSGDIAVYYDLQGTEPVTLPKSWALWRGSFPTTLFVTGTAASSAEDDVELILQYDSSSGCVDSDAISYTVLNLQIIEPDHGQQFCFTSATPGTLSISATGTTGVAPLDANPNNLKWTLTDKTPLYGANQTFTYDSLPGTNAGFGQKTLTLEFTPANLTATKTLELFYPKTATNNLYGWHNWAYYWQSGYVRAVDELVGFSYVSGQQYLGLYDPEYDRLIVYDGAAEELTPTDLTLYNHFYQASINSGEDGYPSTDNPADDDVKVLYPYWDNGLKVIGPPNAVAITAGANGVIDTVAQGNDEVEYRADEGWVLHVGPDGKLSGSTQKAEDDDWKWYSYRGEPYHIQPMGGVPFTVIVTSGSDGWRDTTCLGDDEVHLPTAHSVQFSVGENIKGIDACAVVCAHELEHQARYDQLRLPGGPPYNYTPTNDGDYIDDNYEEVTSGHHLYSSSQDTYNLQDTALADGMPDGWIPDHEFCAYMAEQYPGQTQPSEDWSDTDGKNWEPELP